MINIGHAFSYVNKEYGYNFPKKRSFRKNLHRVNPTCIKQNSLRSEFKKTIPKNMKHVEDSVYGIDYEYNGITIDQKFCFGELGNNTIKIRVKNRKLVNKSDWTLCINEYGEIELFPTYKLSDFVRKNWGMIAKRRIEQKRDYVSYCVSLDDFYRIEEVVCFKSNISTSEVFETLNEISSINYQEKYDLTTNNFTKILQDNFNGFNTNNL